MKVTHYWGTISKLREAYDFHRKYIMDKYSLTALEVDIILFLANNVEYDTATSIVNKRKISKSHVSATISSLYQKGLLKKIVDKYNTKLIHLQLTSLTKQIVAEGQSEQKEFLNNIFAGFSKDEVERLANDLERISININKKYDI